MAEFGRSEFQKEAEKERKKKTLIIGMGVCVVLIVFLAIMVIYYKALDAKTFKLFLDNARVNCSADFYITDQNGNGYIKAKEFANLIGWTYQNGEYGSFTEDVNSGYIQNEYEIASFVKGSTTLKKYIQLSNSVVSNKKDKDKNKDDEETITFETVTKNGTLSTSTLSLPIISSNNQLYLPIACIPDICVSTVSMIKNNMQIYSQNYLIALAQKSAEQNGYTNLNGYYENIRAIAYGMYVVEKNGLYGVVNISNGEQVLGFKYSDIIFQQNVMEFFVKALDNDDNETVGVVNYKGESIISPKAYDEITVLSDSLGLYVVEKDNQYGVLNRDGDVVVHCEYDSIGFSEDDITAYNISYDDNKYLLFDNTIIVKKDGLYGLYNLEGKQVLNPKFSGLGYDVNKDANSLKDSENVLTIELEDIEMADGTTQSLKGIVIQETGAEGVFYGIYDAIRERILVPCSLEKIYAMTKNGERIYYFKAHNDPRTSELLPSIAIDPNIFE